MSCLAEEYPKEQARCRELLQVYADLGPIGAFGHAMISAVLERADKAAAQGDLAAMIAAFKEMKECK